MTTYNLFIGASILDVTINCTDDFLAQCGLEVGGMQLADHQTQDLIIKEATALGFQIDRQGGGSACNTAVMLSNFGHRVGVVSKIGQDRDGQILRQEFHAAGVELQGAGNLDSKRPTGRSLILVTPDGERSMLTALGANLDITANDVRQAIVDARDQPTTKEIRLFLEAYYFDSLTSHEQILELLLDPDVANASLALSLSDPQCVERHHRALNFLLDNEMIHCLFANQAEMAALGSHLKPRNTGSLQPRGDNLMFITDGAKGASVKFCDEARQPQSEKRRAMPVARVIDSTGAGDAFAAGVIHGQILNYSPVECLNVGQSLAALTTGQTGARLSPAHQLQALTDLSKSET